MYNSYWDLTEKERAALSAEDAEKFTAVELMAKGVLKVAPLVLQDVPDAPKPTTTVYRVKGGKYDQKLEVAFRSMEAAQAFIELSPIVIDREYVGGTYVDGFRDESPREIFAEQVFSNAELLESKARLTRANEIREENRKATEEHERATKEEQTVLADIWADRRRCIEKAARMHRIKSTFEQYSEMCRGDKEIASTFLLKAFPAIDIAEAAEWHGFDVKIPPSATTETNGTTHPEAF